MIGIYKITNKINGHAYIGQSVDIDRRWNEHCNKESDSLIHKAIIKYGVENFMFEILEECEQSELDEKEVYWVEYYNTYQNGYNQTAGGNSATCYPKLDFQLQEQLFNDLENTDIPYRELALKYNVSLQYISYVNVGNYLFNNDRTYPIRKRLKTQAKTVINEYSGRREVVSTRVVERPPRDDLAKMIYENGFALVGRKYGVSDNAVRKWCTTYGLPNKKQELIKWVQINLLNISEAELLLQEQQKLLKKQDAKPKAVYQIDKTTNDIIATYASITDAERAIGICDARKHIGEVANGKRKTAYGYKWQFVNNQNVNSFEAKN